MKLRANIFIETSTFFGLIFYNQVQFLNFAKRRSVDRYETPFREKFDLFHMDINPQTLIFKSPNVMAFRMASRPLMSGRLSTFSTLTSK